MIHNTKVIIPGGGGFVGRNLIRLLISENFPHENITIIDKDITQIQKKWGSKIQIIEADLSKKGSWTHFFTNQDIVIHLAAQIASHDENEFIHNNVIATKNIIEASKSNSVSKMIFFSSAAVLSVRKDPYASTKIEAEKQVINSGITYCIIRPSMMFGPTDDKNVGYLIKFAKKFPFFPIPGHGEWPRQPIYIDDILHIIIKMVDAFPNNEIFSINGKDTIFFKDMVQNVLDEIGGKKIVVHLPIPVFKTAMYLYQSIIGDKQFTSDQVDSLASCDIFPEYPWWEIFNIPSTSFRNGVKQMLYSEKY